jgi:primosomal protein N' (replication factor Y)
VVPDLPTFSVDDGFAYGIPPGLDLEVGAIVRVPLGGRRVRGFVTGMRTVAEDTAPKRLKDVASRSGTLPVFDSRTLQTLRWAAIHYVGPLATVLSRTAPPNVPRAPAPSALDPLEAIVDSQLEAVTRAALEGRHLRPTAWVATGPWPDRLASVVGPVVAAARSAMVVVPTAAEAHHLAAALDERLPGRVVEVGSAFSAKVSTTAWGRLATQPGLVAVGTREAALWHVSTLALAVVVEDGRRAMKSPQTPTLHVREVLRRRAAVERFPLVVCGPVPTTEVLGAGASTHREPGRSWRLIEVVDRKQDPDPAGLITDRVRHAIRSVAGRGGRVFAMVHRRGYAPAFRCVQCGAVRRCEDCGAAVTRDGTCRRCGRHTRDCPACGGVRFAPLGAGVGRVVDDLRRSVGDLVGSPDDGRPVTVGTERDLVGLEPVDLAVLVDVDTWLLAPHYRAEEEALRIVARLAGAVAEGSGRRAMVQTAQPDHRVLGAARHGQALPLLDDILGEREAAGFPPSGSLIAVDLQGAGEETDLELRATVGDDGDVLGPGDSRGGQRWLIQGSSLHGVRIRLRSQVQRWRDAGIRVRIDADPIDL